MQKRRKMEALTGQQEAKWTEALRLIETGQTKAYDEAVDILRDLRDLAEYQQRSATFRSQIQKVHQQYSRRSGLLNRLRGAGLE